MEEIKIIVENPEQGISNYEPLKAWALEQANVYGGLIVDPNAITSAKADCANLRKLAKAASDMRIKIKKEHDAKIATIVAQLNEVSGIFTEAAAKIDNQVKAYDEQRKAARREEIQEIYNEEIGDLAGILTLERLSEPSWLNKSTSLKTVRGDIQAAVFNARQAIEQIKAFGSKHETEILSAYLERLNMMDALAAKQRLEEMDAALAKRQAEEEARRQSETEQEEARRVAMAEANAEYAETPFFDEPSEKPAETFDFAFTVVGATQAQVDTLIAFLEDGGYNYAVEI